MIRLRGDCVAIVGLLVLAASAIEARADEWMSPIQREYPSAKGKHVLRVTPGRAGTYGHCKAELFKVDAKKRELVWSRHLINNSVPVKVFVADSGKYVVTMDEWCHVGKFPVVIYGQGGRLIKVHCIETLGLQPLDTMHIKRSVSSYWWNQDAIIFFGRKEETLSIRLHWGKMLILNLPNGGILNADSLKYNQKRWKSLQKYANKRVEEIALEKLNSKEPSDRKTGALAAGQLKIGKAVVRLRELLNDDAAYTTKSGNDPPVEVFYVRKAAKEALEAMGEKVKNVIVTQPIKKKGKLPNAGAEQVAPPIN